MNENTIECSEHILKFRLACTLWELVRSSSNCDIIAVSLRISLFWLREQFFGQTFSQLYHLPYSRACVSLNECNENLRKVKEEIRRECAEWVAGLGLHAAAGKRMQERYAYRAQSSLRGKKMEGGGEERIKKVEERSSHVTFSIEEAVGGEEHSCTLLWKLRTWFRIPTSTGFIHLRLLAASCSSYSLRTLRDCARYHPHF